jgi:hypothetical protein
MVLRWARLAVMPSYLILVALDLGRLRKNRKYFPHVSESSEK